MIPPLNENEQAEQALMGHEEELKKEFERDCAKEWNKRRLAREYATADGEGFGRDGIYRVDRFGCMEMYVGEFDEDPPPSEPTLTEQWEYYVGGEPPPADLLKQEQLDDELMRIGKHEHMKQLGRIEKEESAMLESSGPVLRMMFTEKRSTNMKKKIKKEIFSERGEWREGDPGTSHYFR